MSDKRMIHRQFFESEAVACLSLRQRLLILGIIAIADDQGRTKGHPQWLRAQIFPYDDITKADVQSDLDYILSVNDTLIVYEAGGKAYIQLSNWWDYQSLQWAKESEYPPPPEWQDRIRQMVYTPKRWVMTKNWPGSDDCIEYQVIQSGNKKEGDDDDDDHYLMPLGMININTDINNDSSIKTPKDKNEPDIPENLDTSEFRATWKNWVKHRKEIKKPLTPTTVESQYRKLSRYDVDVAIAMLEQSIENGWRGIFEIGGRNSRASPESETNKAIDRVWKEFEQNRRLESG